MTKSTMVRRLLRGLITLLGAGAGAALAMLGLRIYAFMHPASTVPILALTGMYALACAVGAAILYFLSVPIMNRGMKSVAYVEQRLEKMPMSQLLPAVIWLIVGLLVAALLTQLLGLMGEGIFATAAAAILYVLLGALGWSLGWKRGKDFLSLLRGEHRKEKTARRTAENAARVKILDTSAIIDGRILEVCRTGFLEGEMIAPQFVLDELRHVADSADPIRRARGRRGLDILQKMQDEGISLRVDTTDFPEHLETDVKLLKLCQQLDGAVITGDYNLSKVAAVAGIRVLNLNDLAGALKPVAIPGEELRVRVIKEGKEYGQGVAYMPDGTMIVVEGGKEHMSEDVAVEVTSVLQTSAGRMIFTKLKGA